MAKDTSGTVTQEAFEEIMAMVENYDRAKTDGKLFAKFDEVKSLAEEMLELDEAAKLKMFEALLGRLSDDDVEEAERLYKVFEAAWGRDHNDRGKRKLKGRFIQFKGRRVLKERKRARSLLRVWADAQSPEEEAEAIKFERADQFYQGDFYVPKIGHLYGYRGDFSDSSATLNEEGWYHFGRLLKINYYNRKLTFTNELGQQVIFHHNPLTDEWDADELVENAVQYKGQSILVSMKTSVVDPDLDSDEFFAWSDDPKNAVGSLEARVKRQSRSKAAGVISNKNLATRVAKRRRDHAAHATNPNYQWVQIGKLTKVTESKNAFTLQGTKGKSRRHFIRKNSGGEWEEVSIRAQKLEGQEVLICLADRGPEKTPQVIDLVPADDPIRFIEERFEFSQEETSRRRAAIKAAEEAHTEEKHELDEMRQTIERSHDEQLALMMQQLRYQRDDQMAQIKSKEREIEEKFISNMDEAKQRLSAAIAEQSSMIDGLVALQATLRREEDERLREEFIEEATNVQKPSRSKARQIADSINETPRSRTASRFSPWSAKSQRISDEQNNKANAESSGAAGTEDSKDLEIRLLQAQLRAEKAEKNQAISEAQSAQLKADITAYRMQSESYRNMSEIDRQELLAQLADYHQEQWTADERQAHKRAAAELAEKLKPRLLSSFPVNIPGHYARTSFAMRSGKVLSKDKQLTIELREHLWGNDYRVFIEEHMVEIVACLQVDKRNQNQIAAVTFKSLRKGWQKAESEVNQGLTIKKSMSIEEAVKVFEDTQAKLDFTDL